MGWKELARPRGTGPARWRAAGGLDRNATVSLLRESRRLSGDLSGGLHGRRASAATRRLRRMLDVEAVMLADLDGPVTQCGSLSPGVDPRELLAQVYEHGSTVRTDDTCAVPLIIAGELAGALVARGDITDADLGEAAALVAESLDHAMLRQARDRIASADLRSLRAQISPHFVHNALAAIGGLVRTDPDEARQLLSDFADYLRYSFSAEGDYATVAAELQATQTYLELQRARFRERLHITVRMAPEVLPVVIPFLIVQPIVENAIRHGLEPKPGPGHISVSGYGEGPLCVIEIEDDGVGMDPELARAILAGTGPPAKRVGLANVDKRLRTVYGPEYGLVIETAPEDGTNVMIRVPRFMRGVMSRSDTLS